MASFTSPTSYNSSRFGAAPSRANGSWTEPRGTLQDGRARQGFMHLKDIMVTALPDLDRGTPLNAQLDKAEGYISAAKRDVDFRRPDLAYKDYLKGFEVAVNYIPRHKDYGFYCDSKKGWEQRYKNLCRTIREMGSMMEEVRRMIEDDNADSGVQPKSDRPADSRPPRRSSAYENPYNGATSGFSSSNPPQNVPRRTGEETSNSITLSRSRAASRPMPDELHITAVSESPVDLSERFAQLRAPSNGTANAGSVTTLMPSPSDYLNGIKNRPQQDSLRDGSSPARPIGPREMPINASAPSLPPKIPLMTAFGSMPKPPSPTYSPAKSVPTSATPNFTRPSVDTNHPLPNKRPSYYNQPNASAPSIQLQRAREENPYRPTTPNGVHSIIVAKSNSAEIPHEPAISATKLMEYMKKYNVLIIDVRDREAFDQGHIFAKSILCIEPVALKEGVSAEELEERLVVSPESEQSLFERRNEYDLVVYHDQNTKSIRYLEGPPTGSSTPALRALYDTLYEFNHYKQLKDGRPPALLIGGIDAWVDLMGSNSLTGSNTLASMGAIRRRRALVRGPGAPITRQRMASMNSSLEVRKRRLREYKPLNPDEEEAWRQKAHEEEVDTNEYAQGSSDGEQGEVDESEPVSPFVHDYEAFLRKFPEVQGPQQSMVMASQRPAQRPYPRFDPPPIPSTPSRPPPAVPRPSYSGQADLNQSQAPLARQTSALRPPLYTSHSVTRRMKLPRTGLTNFGVTCYMNATLQCLSATIPLSQFFLDERYKNYLQKNWKGSTGIMPDLYTNLIRSLWKSDVEVIKPTTFRNFCGRMNREWGIDRQQDAKEFFDFLVDCLHEDLNINWQRTPLKPLNPAEEMQRERTLVAQASTIEWSRFQHRDHSYISSLFAGQHASRLRCTTCRNTSTTYEAFYSISVEIPQSGQGNIYDCLRSYCQEEMLSGDEVWKCPHCKCEREATKQIILTRLPQFLVIHFKRFSASKTESTRKIHTPIEFPLHGFNMDHYMIPRAPSAIPNDMSEQKIDAAVTAPFSYDAYGVLRHLGSSGNGGHYVSLVRDPGRNLWRKYDDERSNDFEPGKLSSRDRLTNGEAYIVFYQRAAAR